MNTHETSHTPCSSRLLMSGMSPVLMHSIDPVFSCFTFSKEGTRQHTCHRFFRRTDTTEDLSRVLRTLSDFGQTHQAAGAIAASLRQVMTVPPLTTEAAADGVSRRSRGSAACPSAHRAGIAGSLSGAASGPSATRGSRALLLTLSVCCSLFLLFQCLSFSSLMF